MNLYIIVEGDTELQVYPAWMKYLAPQLRIGLMMHGM